MGDGGVYFIPYTLIYIGTMGDGGFTTFLVLLYILELGGTRGVYSDTLELLNYWGGANILYSLYPDIPYTP